MLGLIKINTALLLCTVFIFRILFVNIGIISSQNTKQNNSSVKTHFSTVIKKRKNFEATNNSGNCDYSLVEICEEDVDDDIHLKSSPLFLIQVLYSSIAGII